VYTLCSVHNTCSGTLTNEWTVVRMNQHRLNSNQQAMDINTKFHQ